MTDNNHEYPLLIAQSGPLEGQRWKIKSELLLGRDSDCDIMIPLREVSRHHARIFIEDGNQMVEDLNSKNGTYLNRRPIQAAMPLKDGDELQISISQHFIFLSSDATMPLEGFPLELQKRRLRIDVGARRVFVMDPGTRPPTFRLTVQSITDALCKPWGGHHPPGHHRRRVGNFCGRRHRAGTGMPLCAVCGIAWQKLTLPQNTSPRSEVTVCGWIIPSIRNSFLNPYPSRSRLRFIVKRKAWR